MTECTKCNPRHLLHHYVPAKLLHFLPTLCLCFWYSPKFYFQNSGHRVSLEVSLDPVILLSRVTSCNFSFQSKSQTLCSQQSVVCIRVSYYLSNFFCTLLCNHPVLALGYLWCCDLNSLSLLFGVPMVRKYSLPLLLIATLASSDPCLNGIIGRRIYMAD